MWLSSNHSSGCDTKQSDLLTSYDMQSLLFYGKDHIPSWRANQDSKSTDGIMGELQSKRRTDWQEKDMQAHHIHTCWVIYLLSQRHFKSEKQLIRPIFENEGTFTPKKETDRKLHSLLWVWNKLRGQGWKSWLHFKGPYTKMTEIHKLTWAITKLMNSMWIFN